MKLLTVYPDGENEIGGVLTGYFDKDGRIVDVETIQMPNMAKDKKNEYLLPRFVMWKLRKHLKIRIVLKEYKELTNLERMKMPEEIEHLRSELLGGQVVFITRIKELQKKYPAYFKLAGKKIIGEWHSHPGGNKHLSQRDMDILRKKALKKPYYRIAIVYEVKGEPKLNMWWLKKGEIVQDLPKKKAQ